MDNELAKVLAEKFNVTVEYAANNLPQLVEEFLHWNVIDSILGIVVFSVVIIVISALFFHIFVRVYDNEESIFWDWGLSGLGIIIVIPCAIIGIIGIITIIYNIFVLIEIHTAPNVFVMEYVINHLTAQ